MAKTSAKTIWVRVLNEAPLFIRRRASAYLQNIRKTSENEWMVWSDEGAQYRVRLERGRVSCSCPYSQQNKGYCKHICAIAAFELTNTDVIPWLRKLEERSRNLRVKSK